MIRILVIEVNKERIKYISSALKEQHYDVVLASNASEALEQMDQYNVHLIVANSDCGGMELSSDLRNAENTIPIIILTENTSGAEKRRIFRSGADGYMFFPLDGEELQMRIKNLLWRCNIVDESVLRFGSTSLHAPTLTVETDHGDIELRHMEFLLLEKLLSYPGRIFTRPQLMDELWGFDTQSDPRTVDTHIRRLRKKLRDVDDIRIQTIRGLGYRASMPRRVRKAEESKKRNLV